jgi:hypothetical protein
VLHLQPIQQNYRQTFNWGQIALGDL